MEETKTAAKDPTISVSRDEYGKTIVRVVSNTPAEIEDMFYDTVESVVEHKQCPPDVIMRAVTQGMIRADGKVRSAHAKEWRDSSLIFGISMAVLAGTIIFSVIRSNPAMAVMLLAAVTALSWERYRYRRG